MAYLVAHLAWPLVLLALAGGAAGWFWHALRTAAHAQERERTRAEIRAALFALDDERPLLDGDAAALIARVRELEAALEAARRRSAEFEALAVERDDRVTELRGALVEAEAHRARADDAERRLSALAAVEPMPAIDIGPYESRIAALEAELAAARTIEPSATETPTSWRARFLEHRLSWAERGRARPAGAAALDSELAAARAEIEALRAKLAAAALVEVSPSEDELNVLRWRSRYLDGRVRYLEGNAAPPAPVQPEEDPELAARAKWRARYMTSRIAYLEGREKELVAAPPTPAIDPNLVAALQNEIVRIRNAYGQLQSHAQAAVAAANERQGRIQALERDLAAALEMAGEADALRMQIRALEEAQAAAADPADLTRTRWSARYLGARVRWLETRLAEEIERAAAADREARELRERPSGEAPTPQPLVAEPAPSPPEPEPAATVLRERRFADPEPRYVWRRVRVIDEPAPEPRARQGSRRREEMVDPEPARIAQTAPTAKPTRRAPPSTLSIADRPPGLPAPRGGAPDDLRMIAGIGPKIESTLNSLGIYHFDQVAGWTAAHVEYIDQYLAFPGRIARESWIEQARALARGEETEGKRRYLQGEHV
jgi:predicted flap endonuclease-1-like 5' DNA nuclease